MPKLSILAMIIQAALDTVCFQTSDVHEIDIAYLPRDNGYQVDIKSQTCFVLVHIDYEFGEVLVTCSLHKEISHAH